MEETYVIPENPEYSESIRKLQDSDPASASATFNPLIEALIGNIHYLYLKLNAGRQVLAVRETDGDGAPDEEDTVDAPVEDEETGWVEDAAVDDAGETAVEDEEAAEAQADMNA